MHCNRGALLPLLAFAALTTSCSENKLNLDDGLYAKIVSTKGDIVIQLFPEEAPLTVMNFVGLAEGTLEFANKKGPFYDGLKFHRVIEDFMIQGGDPQGNGTGGPGYSFPDETDNGFVFDKPGLLAMANSGPDTNGSQFFITRVPTDWLNGKHSIFGQVVKGQDIVEATEQDDVIKKLTILRVGSRASSYKADSQLFEKLKTDIVERQQNQQREMLKMTMEQIIKDWPDAILDRKTGIYSDIRKQGSGNTPALGTQVKVHYTGTFMDGKKFDSSRDRNEPFEFPVGEGRVIPGWDIILMQMKRGERRLIILPPNMAYGERGIGPIPPNSWLVFDVELLDF
ncbi:MAG: hypothetical protein B0D92_03250 [Spirochaeta sp. LUC14_002_19_P3]|nr:MAG: hypothetical protein B0D92_03250 [Spirochaeta sp. LUC14_002_19_P3]